MRLSNAFFILIEMIIFFYPYSIDIWYISLFFLILNKPYISGLNPTWSWCIIPFECCWIQFSSILLKIFAYIFIRDVGL